MNNNQTKISELPKGAKLKESSLLPVVSSSDTAIETERFTLSDFRSWANYDNAYSTLADGIKDTEVGNTFLVYTSDNKYSVAEYVRLPSGASQVIDGEGNAVFHLTAKGRIPVKTIAALRNRTPTLEGEPVYVISYDETVTTGGGWFIAKKGAVVDDGGHLISVNESWYWERSANEVNLLDYGIKISSREAGKEVYYDVTDKLQAATKRAGDKGCPLVSSATFQNDPGNDGYPRWGYFITKTWDITGLKYLNGQFNILVRGNTFATTGTVPMGGTTPYCITALNCKWGTDGKFFGTTYGNLVIDKLNLFNMDGYNPNVVLNGILMIASGSRFNFMMATNFNGRAIHFADSYDNVMGDIRVMWSGNQSAFALEVGAWKADSTSSRDESNANTFLAVMAHNCREKSWLIAGSKTNVVRIHDEAILSTTATPSNPIGIESRNGYGYTSCYFSSIGGHLGDVSFATFDKASTVKPVLTIGSSVTCSCDNIASGRDGANVAVISGDPGPSGAGTIASVTCNEFRTLANARTATTALVCNNAILVDPSSPILSGTINGDLTLMSSATWIGLSNLRVGGVTNVGTPAMFSNCTFNGLLNITFDNFGTILNRMRHTFEHCKINDAVKSDTSKVIFRDCSLISTKDFTITGAGEGVRFESSRINMNVIMDNKASLEFIDSEANGTNVATSSTGTILVSNSSWSTGAINATAATQVIIREGSVMQALNGVVNLRVIDSMVTSPFTLGNNARVWLSNANMNDVTISGTGINLDADKTFFNRFVFDSGKTNTGAWRISQDCVAWTTANWVVPTVVSGYGVRTYDISTGTIYKVVSGAWKVVTESTA